MKLIHWLTDMFKKRHDLKLAIIERERTQACKDRLMLLRQYEKDIKKHDSDLRKEFENELKEKMELKQDEIDNLKKLITHLKSSYENLHSLSGEFALEFRTAAILAGKSQNKFANIEDRALREAARIDKKIDKFINQEDL